ncbi:MAG: ATP-binding protein [Chryseolinea sp.]
MTSLPFSAFRIQESIKFNPSVVQDLKDRVTKGEGATLEFKRKAANPEKIVREMVALANTTGGKLLIGVGDDGSIPGIKFPEDDSHVMQKALKLVRPLLDVKETFILLAHNRTVVQYEIAESLTKPHFIEMEDGSRHYFVRVDDKSIRASREMKEIIKQKQRSRNIKFNYGDHEKFLMKYLESNQHITLKEFVSASGLKKFYASNKLIRLVLANVLRIVPNEKGDMFRLAFTKF